VNVHSVWLVCFLYCFLFVFCIFFLCAIILVNKERCIIISVDNLSCYIVAQVYTIFGWNCCVFVLYVSLQLSDYAQSTLSFGLVVSADAPILRELRLRPGRPGLRWLPQHAETNLPSLVRYTRRWASRVWMWINVRSFFRAQLCSSAAKPYRRRVRPSRLSHASIDRRITVTVG